MTLISAIHNVSRSLGCALLAASGNRALTFALIGGELVIYLAYKIARGDFLYWPRIDGAVAVIFSSLTRFFGLIIVNFSGCVHLRHPVS